MDGMTPETLARFDGENGGEIYISFDGKECVVQPLRLSSLQCLQSTM